MRILFVSIRLPKKNSRGDQLLAYKRIEFLCKTNLVDLICYSDNDCDTESISDLKNMGVNITLVDWSWSEALLNLLRYSLNSNTPFQVAYYKSSYYQQAITEVIGRANPEIVCTITLRPTLNLPPHISNLVVDFIDCISMNFYRRAAGAVGWLKVAYIAESKRLLAYEKKLARRSRMSFVVSSIDRTYIGDFAINVLPLGVDPFSQSGNVEKNEKPTLIFTGNMFYGPNIEAVNWFVENCWSGVKREYPQCLFMIVGNNPNNSIRSLTVDPNIIVTGRVHSVHDSLSRSHVAIAPMISGSGMQLKILEAMSCSLPVVTTPTGLGDLSVTHKVEILVANNPELFVRCIIDLIKSLDFRERIGQAGFDYVQRAHSWEIINNEFELAISSLLKS